MKRIICGLAFGLALLLSPIEGTAQSTDPPYGYVAGSARQFLDSAWNDTSAYQVERIYQVEKDRWLPGDGPGHKIVVVDSVVPCQVIEATPFMVYAKCPDPRKPTVHIHTPTTCFKGECRLGGVQAHDANPSRQDRRMLEDSGAPYEVVQSDRNTFVFYFPPPKVETPVKQRVNAAILGVILGVFLGLLKK